MARYELVLRYGDGQERKTQVNADTSREAISYVRERGRVRVRTRIDHSRGGMAG